MIHSNESYNLVKMEIALVARMYAKCYQGWKQELQDCNWKKADYYGNQMVGHKSCMNSLAFISRRMIKENEQALEDMAQHYGAN